MISVVIPTLNEAANLESLLTRLAPQRQGAEIIVCDGGSGDRTEAVARRHGATLLRCAPGRGHQLRAGAAVARGEVILFLHADSVFPPGGLEGVRAVLAAAPHAVGGNFRLVFDGDSRFSRGLTTFYGWMRGFGLYYGDSGIFVRREVYETMGGMRAMALMEDHDFRRRLERSGPSLCITEPPLVTSSRRFEGRHGLAIVWGWLVIHALYYLGVSPRRLARLYNSARR